jgi:hypothetical protein
MALAEVLRRQVWNRLIFCVCRDALQTRRWVGCWRRVSQAGGITPAREPRQTREPPRGQWRRGRARATARPPSEVLKQLAAVRDALVIGEDAFESVSPS